MAHFTDVHVARKLHQPRTRTGGCDCCMGPIKPGETYARWSATPRDEVMTSDHWSHGKAHHPYGSCLTSARTVAT